MNNEQFRDNSQSFLKALHHINLSKQYFEDAGRGYKHGVKEFINIIVSKLEYIINGCRLKLSPELLKEVDADLQDSLAFDSIKDILVKLNTEQRQLIESIALSLSKGEEVHVIDDTVNQY